MPNVHGKALAIVLLAGLLTACGQTGTYPVPPRADTKPKFEAASSSLTVPVTLSLDTLQASLERSTPKRLWSIDEKRRKCISGQRVKALGANLKITPDIGCRIVGVVTRGRLKVTGRGKRISIRMPVNAEISARDVGGVIKRETATGSAIISLDARLRIDREWNPRATVDISYNWTESPGIDFLGQRIRFVNHADRELAGVVANLERELEKEISRINLKPTVAGAWRQAFTVISLNRENPPAWMRITPGGIAIDGYWVEGRTVILTASLDAKTETFVDADPPPMPVPVDLPPQKENRGAQGFSFFIPVIADYEQFEPVLLRALQKLAKNDIRVEGVGRVKARFDKVKIYATEGDRIAVGIDAQVNPIDDLVGIDWGNAKGRIWLTGTPYNAPDSQVIRITNLAVFGDMDRLAGDLLVKLMGSEQIRERIEQGLQEDFGRDYEKVIEAARKAITERREGDFRIEARIDTVRHGVVQATGAGLFLPVHASGAAQIVYEPR